MDIEELMEFAMTSMNAMKTRITVMNMHCVITAPAASVVIACMDFRETVFTVVNKILATIVTVVCMSSVSPQRMADIIVFVKMDLKEITISLVLILTNVLQLFVKSWRPAEILMEVIRASVLQVNIYINLIFF